jgi:hypothetical protein
MSIYLVTYDLRKPGQNYDALYDALKSYPYCHDLESVWFIQSNRNSGDIRDHLKGFIDANDRLFVSRVDYWASWNVPCAEWIKSH